MQTCISVVIPIYNAQKWLPLLMERILHQSLQNLDIILVNDGSQDESGAVCDRYAAEDERIRVVHKENGGVSAARNTGIGLAKGKYIVFVDADDEIAQDYFEVLYTTAERENSDVVVGGYETIPNGQSYTPQFTLHATMSGKELILSAPQVHSNNDLCFCWRYMYRLQLLQDNHIKFQENIAIGEDVVFNLHSLACAKRAYAIQNILYRYRTDNNSAMRTAYKPHLEKSLQHQYEQRKYFSEKYHLVENKAYRHDMARYYVHHIFPLMMSNAQHEPNSNVAQVIKRIRNYEMFSRSIQELGFSYQHMTWKEYLYYLCFAWKVYPFLNYVHGR